MPQKRVYHGSLAGYEKHWRVRKGKWQWPACEGCQQAASDRRKEYRKTPAGMASYKDRGMARQRALGRLQRLYPGEYNKYYAEELSLIRDGGTAVVSNLRDELNSLIGKISEASLEQSVQKRAATLEERRVYFEVLALRRRIQEAEDRVAEFGKPPGDS